MIASLQLAGHTFLSQTNERFSLPLTNLFFSAQENTARTLYKSRIYIVGSTTRGNLFFSNSFAFPNLFDHLRRFERFLRFRKISNILFRKSQVAKPPLRVADTVYDAKRYERILEQPVSAERNVRHFHYIVTYVYDVMMLL